MNPLAAGVSYLDLLFRGTPRVIATVVLHAAGGVALIDPGPTSTLPALRKALETSGIAIGDVTTILLTHIHLDHAGSTGTLLRENPKLRVYVHERGAPHLIDPAKLLASATRLYGDAMDTLWGAVLPVPAQAVVSLKGGERLDAGGRTLTVAYTPGHASHHVSFYSADTGVAFVGDTAGVKVGSYVLPPTPPPDIDLDLWQDSLTRIEAWRPETLFLTHFGPSAPCRPHLIELRDHFELTTGLVLASLARDESDEAREKWFAEEVGRELRRRLEEPRAYEAAAPFDLNWRGLARYVRKRGS